MIIRSENVLKKQARTKEDNLKLWQFSILFSNFKTKKFMDFIKKFRGFLKFFNIWWKSNFDCGNFLKIFIIHKPSLGPCEVPHKIVGPISSAVLMLIGYKQTNEHPPVQTDKKSIYIEMQNCSTSHHQIQAISNKA